MSSFGFLSLQYDRKCSASRITVVSSAFLGGIAQDLSYKFQKQGIASPARGRASKMQDARGQLAYEQEGGRKFNYIMSIRYLGVGKLSSEVPVVGHLVEKEKEEKVRGEVRKVIAILKDEKIDFQDKQRVKSEFGSWHCKKDEKGMLYLLLTEADLPEKHVYAVLAQLRAHLSILPDYQSQADETLIDHSQTAITQICQIFNTEIQQAYRSTNLYELKRGKIIRSSTLASRKTKNLTQAERQSQMRRFNAQFIDAEQPPRVDRLCLNWKSNLFRGAVMLVLLAAIILPIFLIVGKRV